MSHVEAEIASQPALWRRAAELTGAHAGVLPQPGERVAVAGCGTSWFVAQAYAARREELGGGPADAFAASEMPRGRGYDRVLALSRSGTTTEVVELLRAFAGGAPTVLVTADPATPAAEAADAVVALPFADERSVVQTRFATTALALLRAALGEALEPAAADAERALAADMPPELVAATQITFLGRGWTVGLAHEAALKLREASSAWTESYPAMEYRHGPVSIAEPGRAVWMLGAPPDGLAEEVERTGARFVAGTLEPMAELVRAQRLAVARARAAGLDPDRPRNLTRSVVLP
jgi:fructoselysine-6-P-deglycase FrlB-like protein